jgi:hypothetical protein
MTTLIACKNVGKPTLIRPIAEISSILRMVFPDDTVDIYVMNLEVGKTVKVTVNGFEVILEKYA